MKVLRRWYGPYAHARVWKETAHLLLDLVVGTLLFSVVVTLLSVSVGLLITLVGLPLLVLTVRCGRWIATAERARARVLLDRDLPAWPPLPTTGTWWQRAKDWLADGPGWKGLCYGLVMLPWGVVTFTIAVVWWSVAWGAATFIGYGWFLSGDVADRWSPGLKAAYIVAVTLVGWVMVAFLPLVIRGVAQADKALMAGLLAPDREAALEQRVVELQQSRDAGTESAAHELRRIERDLHDGAQQRLVSVAMNLGMAKDRLSEVDDPKARELVDRAHDEAKQAIVELRELVRGIHPAVLTDRGLDAAVSALVARCPVPVSVHSELPRRLSPTAEATAYFVVAEALTNMAKHSRARSGVVRMIDRGDVLVVEVSDDGVGGAEVGAGGGLHGLADRVHGVDGTLRVASPVGGPTTLLMEVPCGS
jgi:signal transduction histidine kinase